MDKSTDSCMTEKQWNKKGYVLKENAEGILGWQSCYYNYKVLRYTENEVEYKPEEAKALVKALQHQYYLSHKRNIERWEREMKRRDELHKIHRTYYQWLVAGKIADSAPCIPGELLNKYYRIDGGGCFGSSYNYYHVDDVRDPETEEEKQKVREAQERGFCY